MKWDRIIAYIFVTIGVAYASYYGVSYYQKIQVVETVSTSENKQQENENTKKETPTPLTEWVIYPENKRPRQGEEFANLFIPRMEAKIPIIEGTHEDELAKGIGHYAGSVLPGEPDNSVLSGHRDTVFRRMGEMKVGDQLHVESSQGTFIYKVEKTWVTKADDRTVIVPHDEPILTLTTCYPFTYIGSAPDRYIIQAKLVERK